MKKINKLMDLNLDSNEMEEVQGGARGGRCAFDNCGTTFTLDYTNPPPEDPITKPTPGTPGGPNPTGCNCGCSGCAGGDGGSGFSVGMMYNNMDGFSCSFFAMF